MKKKGFTLIELLAVIVILAIIALITIPTILHAVEIAKKGAFKNSAYGIVEAAEIFYARNMVQDATIKTFQVMDGKLVAISGEEIIVKGSLPKAGSSVVINEKGQVKLAITNGTYFASKEFDETEILITEKEGEAPSREELASKLEELEEKINNLDSNVFLKSYPVGSIYISVQSENPSTLYGGTWESYGTGRTLVGVDSTQTEFATVEKEGGEKAHTLSINEMPNHDHPLKLMSGSYSAEGHSGILPWANTSVQMGSTTVASSYQMYSQSMLPSGGSQAHNNLQPYITVYMWKRTK